MQITVTTFARLSPNSSNLFFKGESSSSFSFPASITYFWIVPISVFIPMLITIPIAAPLDTNVPEKRQLILS